MSSSGRRPTASIGGLSWRTKLPISTEMICRPLLAYFGSDRLRNAGRPAETNPAIGNRSNVMRQSATEIQRLDVEEGTRAIEFRSGDEPPRMLIADDDPALVRLLADHWARMGFDVDTAHNGIQALLKASRTKPDIIVIDV